MGAHRMQAGWCCPICHRQSHSTLEPGCDVRRTHECMSAAGPPSIEHTMITISCCVLCEVLACLLNKDFLAKKVRDPSHVRWMGAL